MRRALAPGLLLPATVEAHSFGKLYNLPIPFWLYAWGAAAALVVSFLVVAWFFTQPSKATVAREHPLDHSRALRVARRMHLPPLLKALSLGLLLLCIASGLWGTGNAYLNFNMTFFWIVFVLGGSYLAALVGNGYAVLNPWQLLACGRRFAGRVSYPERLGCWPALGLYLGFIWLELFGQLRPFGLSMALLGYTLLNLLGAWLFGARDWFAKVELFSVLLRLLGRMAPLAIERDADGRSRWALRWPGAGLLQTQATGLGEVLLILFMLSSTSFDGLRETAPWKQLMWVDLRQALLPWTGPSIVTAYPLLQRAVLIIESGTLLVSPLLYLGAYLVCLELARRLTRSPISLHALARRFAYTLLPIALVYNLSHYYTLIITQGPQILRLASDPLGLGWNLFGTALWLPAPLIPAMGAVWHTQVWLILAGHILSVVLAHRVALELFTNRRQATLSQLPLLVLMVLLTTLGLWILALPITSVAGMVAA